jgi:hypothetical protein
MKITVVALAALAMAVNAQGKSGNERQVGFTERDVDLIYRGMDARAARGSKAAGQALTGGGAERCGTVCSVPGLEMY